MALVSAPLALALFAALIVFCWVDQWLARDRCRLRFAPVLKPGPFLALALTGLLAGCGASAGPRASMHGVAGATAGTAATPPATRVRHRSGDVEARASFVLARRPSNARHAPAPASLAPAKSAAPVASAASGVSPGAPSDAEIRQELKQMHQALKAARAAAPVSADVSLLPKGRAQPPAGAPPVIARIVAAGNAIAHFPYVWGGGHRSFVDSAYDCSGSVSYALAAGGMVRAPMTSGQFMRWGVPGPGRWITVYAKAGHVFMYVGGVRFDTSFRAGPFGSRWQDHTRSSQGFVARHWPGL